MMKPERPAHQEAIIKATHLFWEKGFHATTMRNLQDFIDMRPGSIYASFGSKEGLFKEALRHYTDSCLLHLAACSAGSSPLETLKGFIRSSIMCQDKSSPSDMCMLVKAVAELTEDNAELLAESKHLLKKVENAYTDVLTHAQECGELDESKDPRRLACFLQVQVMGLSTYSRANNGNARVNELIDDAFTCLH